MSNDRYFLYHRKVIITLKDGTKRTGVFLRKLPKDIEIFYVEEHLRIPNDTIEDILVPNYDLRIDY